MKHSQHEPEPEFIHRLEDQLATEYRRQERLGLQETPKRYLDRLLRPMGFLLVGVLIGWGTMATAQRIEQSADLEHLRQQATLNIAIATERVAITERVFESIMNRVDAGIASPMTPEFRPAMFDANQAQVTLDLARLDLEELEAGGDPSRNEICAPLVGSSDFFSMRLQIQRDATVRHLEYQQEQVELNELRVRVGTEVESALTPLYAQRDRLEITEQRITEALALRKDFVAGRMDSEEAELRHRLLLTEARRRMAQVELDLLRTQQEMRQARFDAGLVTDREAITLERELLEAEAAVQLAEFEADLLARRLNA